MIRSLNLLADGWWHWHSAMFLQVSVLILLVFVTDLCIRRWAWPRLRHALWLLVFLKLLLPPSLTSPASLVGHFWPKEEPAPIVAIAEEPEPLVAATPAPTIVLPADPVAPLPTTDAPAVARTPSPRTPLSWKVWPMLVWAAGVLVLFTWLVVRLRRFRRDLALAKSDEPPPEWVDRVLREAAAQLKLRRVPQVQISHATASPAVFGLFRPVILLPASETHALSEAEGRHILLHELAHVKRGDLFLHALHMILLILYWFNPLLWVVRRFFQNLRELCCDATVANALRQDVPAYRETLLNTARRLLAQTPPTSLGLLGWFENSRWLGIRLRWLEKNTWKRRWLQISATLFLVLTIASCVLPMGRRSVAMADENHPEPALDAASVLAEYEKHRDQAPRRYILAKLGDHAVYLMFRDGNRYREARYRFGARGEGDKVTDDRKQAGKTLASILAWSADRTPTNLRICDGTYALYAQSDTFGGMVSEFGRSRRSDESIRESIMYVESLRALCWPDSKFIKDDMDLRLVPNDPYAQTNNLLCLEYSVRPNTPSAQFLRLPDGKPYACVTRFYLNPERKYICERQHELRSGHTREMTAFSPAGHDLFLPTACHEVGTGGSRAYEWRAPLVRDSTILYDFSPSFPDGIFDLDAVESKYRLADPKIRVDVAQDPDLKRRSLIQVGGTIVAGDTGKPIPQALVRVAVPSSDMHKLRAGFLKEKPQVVETHADEAGRFLFQIPVEGETSVSVDAMAPGFSSASSRVYSVQGDTVSKRVEPGTTLTIRLALHRAKYVAGTVVDEKGKPVAGAVVTADLSLGEDRDYVMLVYTDADGRFEIFEFPPRPLKTGQKGRLTFQCREARIHVLDGIYEMDDKALASLVVKLDPGVTIRGTLLHADGTPASNTGVDVADGKRGDRKRATTDEAGRFRLPGLEPGDIVLHAHGTLLRENCSQPVSLQDRDVELTLRMQLHPVPKGLKTDDLLGIQVAAVTPELQQAYDLPSSDGLVVIDPGTTYGRLGLEKLQEGSVIRYVGQHRIGSASEAAEKMLPIASPFGGSDTPNLVGLSIWSGWATWAHPKLKLSPEDIPALKALCGIGPAARSTSKPPPAAAKQPETAPAKQPLPLRFGEPIRVDAASGSLKIGTVTFTKRDDVAVATFSAQYSSHPKTTWQACIALLDGAGRELTKATSTIENSGIVLGVPFVREEKLELSFPLGKVEKATQFTLTIDQLAEVQLGKPLTTDQLWSVYQGMVNKYRQTPVEIHFTRREYVPFDGHGPCYTADGKPASALKSVTKELIRLDPEHARGFLRSTRQNPAKDDWQEYVVYAEGITKRHYRVYADARPIRAIVGYSMRMDKHGMEFLEGLSPTDRKLWEVTCLDGVADYPGRFLGLPLNNFRPPAWKGTVTLEKGQYTALYECMDPKAGDNSRRRHIFDASRGLFPIFTEIEIRPKKGVMNGSDWTMWRQTREPLDAVLTQVGLWFPRKMLWYERWEKEDGSKETGWSEIVVDSVTFNPTFADDAFDFEFPPGTEVQDQIAERTYTVPEK